MAAQRSSTIRVLILITLILGLLSGATAGALLALTRDLPQIRRLEDFEPSAVTQVYSADHVLLAEWFIEKRTPVPIDRIPADLKAAIIAVEDRKFYAHSGIDFKGVLRAIVKDVMAGEFVEGASTITQQLAKTLFLTREKKISRKIREAILAVQLERRYTKDELLALYLNQIYLGSGAYGVEAAARRYFGKPAAEMNLAECALIAGLPKAPSRYSPLVNAERAKRRRDLVLRIMRGQGLIGENRYRQAVSQPVSDDPPAETTGAAPYFVHYIRPQLEAAVGPDLLYKGGLTVHTTLSHRLQQSAETALRKGLAELQARRPAESAEPQGALVATDVKTGAILAMVGGRDFADSAFDRAARARRQPGSAFKPVVYALAVARGFTQASLLLDAPVVFRDGSRGGEWRPENFSKRYQGEVSLRYALTHSENIPAVRLMETLGPTAVVQFARRLGIDSPLSPNLSLALGSDAVSLMELTAAYAVFPNGGNHVAPFGVAEVRDRDDALLWRMRPAVRPVLTAAQAAVMVDMLHGVVEEGTGRRARRLGMPLAGKTGTTDDYRDALFVGFSPTVTAGVWVGMDDFTSLGPTETGARAALPIWIDFMAQTRSAASPRYFDIPDRTHRVWMDARTGRVAAQGATHAVQALFIDDTAPRP